MVAFAEIGICTMVAFNRSRRSRDLDLLVFEDIAPDFFHTLWLIILVQTLDLCWFAAIVSLALTGGEAECSAVWVEIRKDLKENSEFPLNDS